MVHAADCPELAKADFASDLPVALQWVELALHVAGFAARDKLVVTAAPRVATLCYVHLGF
jgi:hypothetical protein